MDDRRSATSIFLMASEAIRKAVTYHHTQIGPSAVDIQEDLRTSICSKIRDQPGGTLAIRTTNVLSSPSLTLQTTVAYRPPASAGSRREAREQRRREAREARRHIARARGDPTHTLSFFGYDTDVSEEEPSSEVEDAPQASRKRRVRRSLIRRLSYYPPRAPDTRQIRLDFVNLEQGADFTPPLYGEEFEEDGGVSSGMDSDFAEPEDVAEQQAARPATLLALANALEGGDRDFSPTASTRHLVQGLTFATPPPLYQPQPLPQPLPSGNAASVWGVEALGASTPLPDRDAAAAALWQATEAAWDAAAAAAPPTTREPAFVLRNAPGQSREAYEELDPEDQSRIPHISDQERLGESAFNGGFISPRATLPPNPIALPPPSQQQHDQVAAAVAAAFAAAAVRPVTPPPPMPHVQSEEQLQLLSHICNAIIAGGRFPPEIVAAYVAEAAGTERVYDARLVRGYVDLRTTEERAQFRQLHGALQCVWAAAAAGETIVPAAEQAADALAVPAAAPPPAATASAPATPAPTSSSSHRIEILNIPGIGVRRIEEGGDLPATFTSRARMKRQREQRAATAAALEEARAGAAAYRARQAARSGQQPDQTTEDAALVAGPSASFEHDRRKRVRVEEEEPCNGLPTGSGAAASAAAAAVAVEQQQQSLQRVLGTVVQHPAAAGAACTSSVAAHPPGPCSCPHCPTSSSRQRLQPSSSLPSPFQVPISHHAPVLQPQPIPSYFDLQQQQDFDGTQIGRVRPLAPLMSQQPIQLPRGAPASSQTIAAILQQLQQQQLLQQQLQQAVPAVPQLGVSMFGDLVRLPVRSIPSSATTSAPSLPRMDPMHFYPFMPGMMQPSAPPPSFVDLPDANPIVSRGHMFNQSNQAAASSLSAAAAAAANAAVSLQPAGMQLQQGDAQHHQRIYELLQMSDQQHVQLILSGVTAGLATGGEAAPIGANQRDIEKFSSVQEWKATPGDTDADPCTVCMCDFEEGESVRNLPCHHSFHVRCIDRWLGYNKKCPNCRVDLDQNAAADAAAAAPTAAPAATAAPAPDYSVHDYRAQLFAATRAMGQALETPPPTFPSILGNIRMG